ncbi:MAG: GTPase HflX [Chloroflexi bacterium]|nr:GTPase HflX [Chloroflexota bacterium]
MPRPETFPTEPPTERAFLVGVELKNKPGAFAIEDSMRELERLADTDGLEIAGQAIQRVERLNPATMIGKGKLQEIVAQRAELNFDVLIFNDELAPNQQREIENAFEGADIKVLDRTALILDIFAQHARTREGALQVELAQYEYRLPRLTRMWTHLARQAGGAAGRGGTGGVGLRGPGERQLELDRREIRARIAHLKQELERVRKQRGEHRRKRQREGIPVVSIVGYTNAGKSTLLNALTHSEVYVADQLFATLDPTTRRVQLPSGQEVLFSDTVGFIEKLPTQLIAAFRATLEEIVDSNVLLHVVDITHPNAVEQVSAVEETLEEIGAVASHRAQSSTANTSSKERGDWQAAKPVVMALNKIDGLGLHKNTLGEDAARFVGQWLEEYPDAAPISAAQQLGLDALLERVEAVLGSNLVAVRARIPYHATELVNLFHRKGIVEHEEYSPRGTLIEGKLPQALVREFEVYRV